MKRRGSGSTYFNLVLAFGGPYGAGCSSLGEELQKVVGDWPGCHVERIRVSELIDQWYRLLVDPSRRFGGARTPTRRHEFQEAGTDLRRRYGNDFVGKMILAEIHRRRILAEKKGNLGGGGTAVFLVDSLKNFNELAYLRRMYSRDFYFVFVHAAEQTRWKRMRDYYGWDEKDREAFVAYDKCDKDEAASAPGVKDAGQQVGKLAPHADYYVVNETNRDALRHEGRRFFSLLLGFGTYQPLRDERAMHLAFSAGAGSYCLSRQVGAAILDDRGNVLGVGHNDVPKAGGGLYTSEDAHDRRCHLVGNRTCINDTNKQERFEGLAASLAEELECKGKHSSILTVIERSEFAQATEYCRAVHAEMEAILSVGRNAHSSTVGSTMYVTTQPCHNCTKHIICAGIKRVVYVEPYPKSLGDELHSDAFAFVNGRAPIGDRVCFSFYQGVAPHRFHEMFAMFNDRKTNADGKMIVRTKRECAENPRFERWATPRPHLADLGREDRIGGSEGVMREKAEAAEFAGFMEDVHKKGGGDGEGAKRGAS